MNAVEKETSKKSWYEVEEFDPKQGWHTVKSHLDLETSRKIAQENLSSIFNVLQVPTICSKMKDNLRKLDYRVIRVEVMALE